MKPTLSIHSLTLEDAEEVACWRYEAPYDIYNVVGDAKEHASRVMHDRTSRFHSIYDGDELIGFFSLGRDGQVPGGPYDAPATDIGMLIKPERIGLGQGHLYAAAVTEYASRVTSAGALRVTIARFNVRAQRLWQRIGFAQIAEFSRSDGPEFVVMVRSTLEKLHSSAIL